AKSEIYIPVSAILPYSITIGDLQSISYWTNKPGDSGSPDWTFYIYTALGTGTGANEASWYHTRLNSEPYLTGTPSASDPSNTWHEWSTGDPANPMRFYDAGRDGGIYGTYTDPTLANLEAGAINWNSYNSVYANNTYDYRGDVISKFSLQTGSAWGNGFQGMVDGVTIALNNGDTVKLNLDAVPEPASVVMLLTMVGLVGGALRRKAKK
ncbi:MAG TPA: PEP-CTERM sorting domain-containing protein, partial [Candidatus Sulfopaludibacter sp.]|nr:PEP-CTERM sorting domain-containing protein [Candidatus Sulfopaludibacter sp.]